VPRAVDRATTYRALAQQIVAAEQPGGGAAAPDVEEKIVQILSRQADGQSPTDIAQAMSIRLQVVENILAAANRVQRQRPGGTAAIRSSRTASHARTVHHNGGSLIS